MKRKGANHLTNTRRRSRTRRVKRGRIFRLKNIRGRSLAVWMLALALIGVAGFGVHKVLRTMNDGRHFIVTRIEVTGNRHWESSRLLEKAGLEVGASLPQLSIRKVRESLRRLPGIREAIVRPSLKGLLRLEVKEEDLLAQRMKNGWEGLTTSGVWMPLRRPESDLPVIEAPGQASGWDGVALAQFLSRAKSEYPRLFEDFSQIQVRGAGEAEIFWRDGSFKMRVDYASKSLNSLEFLQALLSNERASWAPGSTVDLRVEGYAYVL